MGRYEYEQEMRYFSGLFSIARPPPSQEAREADAREAVRQEAARQEAAVRRAARRAAVAEGIRTATFTTRDISAREMHLISLADAAYLPKSAAVDVCVICHEALMGGQRLAATVCGHVFCAGCIGMSLRHNDACPTCRVVEPTVTLLYM